MTSPWAAWYTDPLRLKVARSIRGHAPGASHGPSCGGRSNMRARFLSRLCCLLILSLGSAPAAGGVSLESVSLRAGGSYSAFEGSFHDAVDGYIVGFTAAGGVGLRLGPVPIQAELWVIRKGGRMGSLTFGDSTFGSFTFPAQRWLVSYVEAPV